LVLRVGGGEPLPFRTVAAVAGLLLVPLVSRLTGHLDEPRPLRNPSAHIGANGAAPHAIGAAS